MPEGGRQQRAPIDLPGPKTKAIPVHTIYRMSADYKVEIYSDALQLKFDEKTKEALYYLPQRGMNINYHPDLIDLPCIAVSMDELATKVMKRALRYREASRAMLDSIATALKREPQE